jgi:hypothetical protein
VSEHGNNKADTGGEQRQHLSDVREKQADSDSTRYHVRKEHEENDASDDY